MKNRKRVVRALGAVALFGAIRMAQSAEETGPVRMRTAYPDVACHILTDAAVESLPEGVLLRWGEVSISQSDLDKAIREAWPGIREELEAFPFFALEQEAATRIVTALAQRAHTGEGEKAAKQANPLDAYVRSVAGPIAVTDAEILARYETLKGMIMLPPLDQVRHHIRTELEERKRQRLFDEHVRTLGLREPIVVSKAWVETQIPLARKNPIDSARGRGKPVLVVFSAAGCCGPDDGEQTVRSVEEAFGEALAFVALDTALYRVLAVRFQVEDAHAFIYYGADGLEIARHAGDMDAEALIEWLNKHGAKKS